MDVSYRGVKHRDLLFRKFSKNNQKTKESSASFTSSTFTSTVLANKQLLHGAYEAHEAPYPKPVELIHTEQISKRRK